MEQRLYTVDEAAEFLQLHPKTLRRKIREGEIESTRVGKRYRLSEAQLRGYLGEAGADILLPAWKQVETRQRVTTTAIVDITAVAPDAYQQLSNYLTAALNNVRTTQQSERASERADGRVSSHCSYVPETAELKIMLSGDIASVQSLLAMVNSLLEARE